eukprot:TRINITY_DN4762_c0_g1_i1.p3 TRINITY_DN4762_c0_g1~~TRINITY_DN4762_c0_g1_i1.p3  ORF type:complete len:56 (+),score=3.37 TRINITY_DN4762_c0_g1_i1:417-584(+)
MYDFLALLEEGDLTPSEPLRLKYPETFLRLEWHRFDLSNCDLLVGDSTLLTLRRE